MLERGTEGEDQPGGSGRIEVQEKEGRSGRKGQVRKGSAGG